ncbi:MAG: hypothetical protein KKD85_11235 [Proteobacteria bacterium]|nr:hypothetical protein [Pseudomonadota bacterium]
MRKAIEKVILKIFPELSGGLHLDRYARVLAVSDAPAAGGPSERFRPRYAVDLEILTPDGARDEAFPVYEAVPLPVPAGCGQEAGLYAFPEPGALVVIGFAYGRADHPLVRQIYPQGMSLPEVAQGQQRWQQSADVYQGVDQHGNWTRKTGQAISDESLHRAARAVENLDEFSRELRRIHEHSKEVVGGTKTLEALGALRLRSGGSANLVAVDNINFATSRDRTLIVGQDRHEVAGRHMVSLVKGDMEETAHGNRTEDVGGNRTESTGGDHTSDVGGESVETVDGNKTIAALHINLEASTIRLGQPGSGISLLPTIISFMEEIRCALHDIAIHQHNGRVPPDNGGEIDGHSTAVGTLKGNMGTISG